MCAGGTCSISRVTGASTQQSLAEPCSNCLKVSRSWEPLLSFPELVLHICRSTEWGKASSSPWEPLQVLSRWMLLFPVWPREPPQQQIALWYLLFLLARKKMISSMFWIRMTTDFPQNSVFIYRERDLIQNWYNSGLISMTFTTGDKLQTEDRGR